MLKNNYRDYILISLIIAITYWAVVFFIFSMKWDCINVSLPWRFFVGNVIGNGELPLWYPNQCCGFGQFVDPQTWYWPSWLFSIGGYSNVNLHLEYTFHLILATIGFFKLLDYFGISRSVRIAVAVLYSSSGFFVGNFQHLGWIVSATWLPYLYLNYLLLLNTNQIKYILRTSLFGYLFVSGGYWGIVIPAFYSLGVIFIIKKVRPILNGNLRWQEFWRSISSNLIFITTLGLTLSVILISVFDSIDLITRGGGLSVERMMTGSFFPIDLLTFFIPFATYTDWEFWLSDVSIVNIYSGGFTLICVVYGFVSANNKRRFRNFMLGGFIVVLIIVSMGQTFPFWKWLGTYLPFFQFLRFPASLRIFTILGILILFAVFIDEFFEKGRLPYFLLRIIGLSYLIIATLLLIINFEIIEEIIRLRIFKGLSATKIPLTASFQLIIVGLILVVSTYIPSVIKDKQKQFRIFLIFIVFEMFVSVQLNMFHTIVQRSPGPRAINKAIHKFEKIPPSLDLAIEKSDSISNLTYSFGYNSATFSNLISHNGYTPYQYNSWVILEQDSSFKSIISKPFLYFGSFGNEDQPGHELEMVGFNNNGMILNTFTEVSEELFLSQNFHKGWKAKVNGQEMNVMKSNISLMSIMVPKGNNVVEFSFEPKWIILGFWVSGLSFILFFIVSFIIKKQI